jgi:hypothetical protein
MTHIVVEYRDNGNYMQKTLYNTEKVEHGQFDNLIGVWHCQSMEECHVMQEQLREMRHARFSQPA